MRVKAMMTPVMVKARLCHSLVPMAMSMRFIEKMSMFRKARIINIVAPMAM